MMPSRPILKRVGAFLAGATLFMSAFLAAPPRAHALFGAADIVFDPGAFVQMLVDWGLQTVQQQLGDQTVIKEYVLDTIARFAAQAAIQSMTKSMTNWASSGFEGAPAFETDFRNSMLRIGDTVADDFVEQLRTGNAVKSPFSTRIAQSVKDNYYRTTGPKAFENAAKYTLDKTCADHEAFLKGDFAACGFTSWNSMWLNPANNPIGSQLLAEDELTRQITSTVANEERVLDWGQGFLSWKGDCTAYGTAVALNQDPSVPLHDKDECISNTIETPGSLISNTANKYLVDAGIDFSVNADELNEVIGNFFANLVQDTLFGDEGGLASAGRYERADKLEPPANAINALRQSVDNQRPKLDQYKRDWDTILDVARSAKAHLEDCTRREGVDDAIAEADDLIERAEAEIERADLSAQKLDELGLRITAAEDGNDDFQELITAYEEFNSSGAMPTVQEMIFAAEQATNQAANGEETYFTRMNRYAAMLCSGLFGRFNIDN